MVQPQEASLNQLTLVNYRPPEGNGQGFHQRSHPTARSAAACLHRVNVILTLLRQLNAEQLEHFTDLVHGIDYHPGDEWEHADLLAANIARAPHTSWSVNLHGSPVGVFAIAPRDNGGETVWQTSTYLTGAGQGTGVNQVVKTAAIHTALLHRLPLHAFILPTNTRSLAAVRNLFTDEPSWTSAADNVRRDYLLTDANNRLSAKPDLHIAAAIGAGIARLRNTT